MRLIIVTRQLGTRSNLTYYYLWDESDGRTLHEARFIAFCKAHELDPKKYVLDDRELLSNTRVTDINIL